MAESKERDNHKYVARVKVKRASGNSKNNQYRYFYTQEAYRAYLKNNTDIKKEDVEYFGQKKSTDDAKSTFPDKLKSVGNKVSKFIDSGKEAVSKLLDNVITDSGWERVDTKDKEEKDSGWKRVDTKKEEKESLLDKIFTHETKISTLSQKDSKKDTKKEEKEEKEEKESLLDKIFTHETKISTLSQKDSEKDTKKDTKKDDLRNDVDGREKKNVETEQQETIKEFSDLKRQTKSLSADENQALVNPNYDPSEFAYSNNCSYCTATYELRQRGYDVEAAPAIKSAMPTVEDTTKWYVNAELNVVLDINKENAESKARELEKKIAKQGDGARGQFCVKWANGGGHSVAYEVKNNDVIIRDCQTGDISNISNYTERAALIHYFRTDNLELSDEILKTVRNRK